MKALLIWDVHVLFYSLDDEFKQFLFKRWHQHTGAEEKEENVREAMEMYFGPMATAAANMDQLKWTPNYITTKDGFYFVFRKISDYLYIAISGDKGASEHTLMKRIHALYRVISLLFGPVTKRVCPSDLASRGVVWSKLARVMECYDRLYQDDLTFLVEAVECVSFASQLTSTEMKKACASAVDAAMIKNVSHAILIVNNKIAMLRSQSRSTAGQALSAIDQLLIILLCNYYNGNPSLSPSTNASCNLRIIQSVQEETPPPDTPSEETPPPDMPSEETPPPDMPSDSLIQEQERTSQPTFVEVAVERGRPEEVQPDHRIRTEMFPSAQVSDSPDQDGSVGDPSVEEFPAVTPTAALHSADGGTPLIGGEDTDEEDTLQPTQVDLSVAGEQDATSEPAGAVGYEENPHLSAVGETLPSKGIKQAFLSLFGTKNDDTLDRANLEPTRGGSEGEDQAGFQWDDSFLRIIRHNKEVVFLRRDVPYCAGVKAVHVPCLLHFMTPVEEITLAVIEELPGALLAASLCLSISHLEDVIAHPTEGTPRIRMEQMEQMIKNIDEVMRRQKMGKKVAETLANILSTWSTLKSMNLLRVLQQGFPAQEGPAERLRNIMENMIKLLVSLFEMAFLMSKLPSHLSDEVVMKIVLKANSPLSLFSGILAMKGLENIPLATCTDHAEDMVYYIFIDRKNNRVIAPSIASPDNTGNLYLDTLASDRGLKAGLLLKEKVWTFVNRVQRLLMNGYTSQIWLDDTFHYCYFLLLYHPSDEAEPFKVAEIKTDLDTPPGELTGSFFRRLRQAEEYMFSFEVFCLHRRSTPTSNAISQSKRLVEKFVRTFSSNPVYGLLS